MMFNTELCSAGKIVKSATENAYPPVTHIHSLRNRLAGGAAACVFLLALLAPISIDMSNGTIAIKTALAGNEKGNSGNGRGNGGPNGQKQGNGGDAEDGGIDDGEDGGGGDVDGGYADDDGAEAGGGEAAFAGEDEAGLSAALDADGSATGVAMPTISQIFSLGDEATISGEAELELIASGWKTTD